MEIKSHFQAYSEKCLQELGRTIENFPWENPNAYALWLAQTFYYVSHSTRLLALGASRFSVKDDVLHQRFLAHAGEEKRHEFLALGDLKVLGYDIDDLEEFASTRSFYQTQYFWIQNVNPKAFYGYIVMLEGLAVQRAGWIEQKVAASYEKNVSRFLKVHANEDPDHLSKAYEFISKLTTEECANIRKNFDQSIQLYTLMLLDVSTTAETIKLQRAS